MAVVGLRINGRQYEVVCDDGQEDHLRMLADEISDRMRSLLRNMGANPGGDMAMMLTALTMADEIIENKKENQDLATEVRRLASLLNADKQREHEGQMVEIEQSMVATLEEIAIRIEKIADQVEMR